MNSNSRSKKVIVRKNQPRRKEWFDDDTFWRELAPLLLSEKAFAEAAGQATPLLRLARPRGKAVLDLGCGGGRFAIALAKRGYQVTGVDRTKLYLDTARAKSRNARVHVEWIQADMRDFVRPQAYDLVISMFTSLGYFDDEHDDLHVMENMFRNLRPGGVCLLDLMGKEILARIGQPTTSDILPDGTGSVVRHEVIEGWTRMRNEWMFINKGRVRTYRFHHTIYSGQELRQLLEQAGFENVRLFGNLDGADYGLDAKRLIAVAQKPILPKLPRRKSACTEVYASARFVGERLDPSDITRALALPPDLSIRKDDLRISRSSKGHVLHCAPYKTGVWSMSSKPWVQSRQLEVHIKWLLSQLEPKTAAIRAILDLGYAADFFCFSSGSAKEPPSLSRNLKDRCRRLGFEIHLDHYPET